MAERDLQHLCSTTTQVQPLVQHRGLKDPASPLLGWRSQLRLGSDSWPRNSLCHSVAKGEKKGKCLVEFTYEKQFLFSLALFTFNLYFIYLVVQL